MALAGGNAVNGFGAPGGNQPGLNGFGVNGPQQALNGSAADNVSIHTESSGTTRQISNNCFEEKANQHIKLAEIFIRLKEHVRVHLVELDVAARRAAYNARVVENQQRANRGEAPLPPVSPFDDSRNPAIGIIPGNKTYVYINEHGERIVGELADVANHLGINNANIPTQINNDVADMLKILKDVNVLSSGGLAVRVFSPHIPSMSLIHRSGLFDYIAKDDALLKAFRDEMLKHMESDHPSNAARDAHKNLIEHQLTDVNADPMLDGAESRCGKLRTAIEAKVAGMANGEAKNALNAAVNSTDIFAAKMLVIMRHIIDAETYRYAGLIMAAEAQRDALGLGTPQRFAADAEVARLRGLQGGINKKIGNALKAFVQAERDKHEGRDGLLDVKYYLSRKVIEEDQKVEEDQFIDDLIELAGNENPVTEPKCLEDILLVGPIRLMKRTDLSRRANESVADWEARITEFRANLVDFRKLVGYGSKQFHYDPINAVRTAAHPAGEGIFYPRVEDLPNVIAAAQPRPAPQPGQEPPVVGSAASANRRLVGD